LLSAEARVTEEPGAGKPHAGICAGGAPASLPRLLRHEVAFNMKLFLSMLETKPPVPPGEPRGLNKERLRQCTEARASVRGGDREGPALLAATSRAMAR
jgi:hypothetical protein